MAYQPKSYRKFLATSVAVAAVATVAAPAGAASSFPDVVPGSYYEEAVNYLTSQDVIKGLPGGIYAPLTNVDRAQFSVILAGALDLELSDNPKRVFPDVNPNSYYGAAVEALFNAGIVDGDQKGNFNPTNSIDRASVAKMVVEAFGFEQDSSVRIPFNDVVAGSWYEGYVNTLYSVGVVNGTTANTFSPQGTVDRAQAAVFVYNALLQAGVDPEEPGDEEAVANVKAINNTTVEVTFEDAVADVKALDFAIEGLTVSNAVVKQTDSKTVVLTTSAQTGGEEYTVTVNNATVGTFEGISAVVPTAVNVVERSLQGVVGKEVTVQAQVTVPAGQSKAGIPVTFNIDRGSDTTLAPQILGEALTDENGVATYTYTRYTAGNDTVTTYATGNRTVSSTGVVYWAAAKQLVVSELTEGNSLANDTKKSYKVTGAANTSYYVAIKENINVTPDKVTRVFVQDDATNTFVTPYELTTGSDVFARVTTDANGEASFTVYGSNLSATPVVYRPASLIDPVYSATALQTQAPTVNFSQVDRLAVSVVAEGSANSAASSYLTGTTGQAFDATSVGGRTYTVTVTDKDGKLAPKGTKAYVTFEEDNINGTVYFSTAKDAFEAVTTNTVKEITVGENGQASFRVAGHGATTFVKPTVFLNTAGSTATPALDKADIQSVAEVTYFKDAVVRNALLTVEDVDGEEVSSLITGTDAYFTYQSVDQNGFAYRPSTTNYQLTFDVTSTFGNAIVKDALGATLSPEQNLGNTKTYKVASDSTGKAVVRVTSDNADTVTVNVTGASGILPTKSASVSFTAQAPTLERVNSATTVNAVIAALTDSSLTPDFDDLSAAQKQAVATEVLNKRPGSGYTQTGLETAYKTAYQAQVDAANQAAAQPVIDAIGNLNNTSLTFEADVAAARAAYDGLTATQQALVTN
ncbi:S-layer homology domain-containing protein, partial [Alkalihalophilus marmarensis]